MAGQQFEVIEMSTGARMAHTETGQIMSTTLFKSKDEAATWMRHVGLATTTHTVRPV